jgi:hypothetical protein
MDADAEPGVNSVPREHQAGAESAASVDAASSLTVLTIVQWRSGHERRSARRK